MLLSKLDTHVNTGLQEVPLITGSRELTQQACTPFPPALHSWWWNDAYLDFASD